MCVYWLGGVIMAKIQISINDDLLERVDVYAKKIISRVVVFGVGFKPISESVGDGIRAERYECCVQEDCTDGYSRR